MLTIKNKGSMQLARTERVRSSTGIYHVIQRGINRQVIFHEDEDFLRYLSTLERAKRECGCELYGYCLMSNHIHLLIREHSDIFTISNLIKKIASSYVHWYNRKYQRTGHLFEERFKSEVVEDDQYLLTVIRYIHQNPTKSQMVEAVCEY